MDWLVSAIRPVGDGIEDASAFGGGIWLPGGGGATVAYEGGGAEYETVGLAALVVGLREFGLAVFGGRCVSVGSNCETEGFGAIGGGGTAGPRVNRIPQRGHVRIAPGGTCVGSNKKGQLGFGHFNAFAIDRYQCWKMPGAMGLYSQIVDDSVATKKESAGNFLRERRIGLLR